MTYVVLVVLAVLWGAFFVSWYRSRASQRVDSVARFSRHLSVLERATPGTVAPLRTVQPSERGVHRISSTPQVARPTAPSAAAAPGTLTLAEAYRRRRTVLVVLAGVAATTLVGAVLAGGPLLVLNLLADAALVTYVVLLVRAQRIGAERRSKVTYLTPATVRTTTVRSEVVDDGALVATARSAHGG